LGLAGLGCCAAVAAQDIRSRDEGSVAGAGVANPRYLPPPVAPQGYRLGVQVRNTDTGVELVSIQSNSVAQRAGLEAGDIIINVAGYQVGYVGDRLYDVGEEIARRVQGNGQVALLVRNRRDGRLLNIPVYFGGTVASRAVTGRLLLKEATAI
ncbi:MAG: PDZ domain-containing protein, partial [Pirellulaceae bacterium]